MRSPENNENCSVIARLPPRLAQDPVKFLCVNGLHASWEMEGIGESEVEHRINCLKVFVHKPRVLRAVSVPASEERKAIVLLGQWQSEVEARLAPHTKKFRKHVSIGVVCFILLVVILSLYAGDWTFAFLGASILSAAILLIYSGFRVSEIDSVTPKRKGKKQRERNT